MLTVISIVAKVIVFFVRLMGFKVAREVIAYLLYKFADRDDENRVREPLVRLILAAIDGDERVEAAINYADARLKTMDAQDEEVKAMEEEDTKSE